MTEARKVGGGRSATRDALVTAAIHLFGRRGYEGASTREISAHAGTNIAAIAYHFGGKEQLRQACAEAVAGRMAAVLHAAGGEPTDPVDAAGRLEQVVRAMVGFLVLDPKADDVAAFMLREVTSPGPVLEQVYAAVVEPRHRDLCGLWACATGGDPESETTRLAVFALVGQVLYFRIGQPLILRRMGWRRIDPAASERIAALLVGNLHSALAAGRAAG